MKAAWVQIFTENGKEEIPHNFCGSFYFTGHHIHLILTDIQWCDEILHRWALYYNDSTLCLALSLNVLITTQTFCLSVHMGNANFYSLSYKLPTV